MAWRARASTHESFIAELVKHKVIVKESVRLAALQVDRAQFVPEGANPYVDAPQSLGHGQTISAPHMHFATAQWLEDDVRSAKWIADVGVGSGYLVALLARMAPVDCRLVGIDVVPSLVDAATANLGAAGFGPDLASGRIRVQLGDAWSGVGGPGDGPFDVIHVGAAAASVPEALVDALAPGGIMILPVGPQHGNQEMVRVTKDEDGKVTVEPMGMGVMYVPLVKK
jgi:protein-L-isoaspartate(D-aspartate) O-methyltransferase